MKKPPDRPPGKPPTTNPSARPPSTNPTARPPPSTNPTARPASAPPQKPVSSKGGPRNNDGKPLPQRASPAAIKVKKPRKLSEITEAPQPSDELAAQAAAKGAKITAYDPRHIEAFLRGHMTLGELQGIPKADQYKMAETGYRLLSEGKIDKAIQIFMGLAALDPFDAYFLTALGSAHQQKDQLADADRFYSRALEINPFSTTARAHRGEVRALLGRPVEAVADLKRAVQEDPQGKDPAVQRAKVMLASIIRELDRR